ncbi:Sacsin [Gigaspora margarita]|uniref:Sacsin n=1 Tax=Gigaspora margarita TaxID=4874 RepID=A0A8H3XAC6_GIGMA|nr:Sacsin [Gigaspora margarita]
MSSLEEMAQGETFRPGEPYTHRLSKILEEYPDGSQIIREILQNSDDAKSSSQIFILDRNFYKSKCLFEPVKKSNKTNLKLDRYQGPALLAQNDTIFEDRDFESLKKLANSEKYDQFDKIGVMGVGFNSVYHICDTVQLITGDNILILDPHENYFKGGIKFDFVKNNLAARYPDQFAPFRVPCDRRFKGSLFRYPLRTNQDALESEISKKAYSPDQILEMFKAFYENESINCLLFLKYIESIKFYELDENETEPKLLYSIEITNSEQIREERRKIAERIGPMVDSLTKRIGPKITTLESIFIAKFCRKCGNDDPQNDQWIIFTWLGDLNAAENYFQSKFEKSISTYKFIPNVGIALPLENKKVTGRLFCFLPLPIVTPFRGSVHGYFAVSTNRRTLWTAADSEDLAYHSLARLKVSWNEYLFNIVLPKAWARFLVRLPINAPKINGSEFYDFWPIIQKFTSGSFANLCEGLLFNTVENLNVDDEVFCGPSTSYALGNITKILKIFQKRITSYETEFHLLSINNGFFPDKRASENISNIVGSIGFPVININLKVLDELKKSQHKGSLKFYSPQIIRTYLHQNKTRWQNQLSREEKLFLFSYILEDKNYVELDGLSLIPLADKNLETISRKTNYIVYIGPDNDQHLDANDERKIFKNSLNKFVDKDIPRKLWNQIYDGAKNGWDLNIKILTAMAIVDLITKSLIGYSNVIDEIQLKNSREWINHIWSNFYERQYDLNYFKDIHLLPTNRGTLRKLKTVQKCFWNSINDKLNNNIQPLIEKFEIVFIDKEFENHDVSKWNKLSQYVIKLDNVSEVLECICAINEFPKNVQKKLDPQEANELIDYLCRYYRTSFNINPINPIEIIKHLPIFTEVGKDELIALKPGDRVWYLLPVEDEKSYGHIIAPDENGFLSANTSNSKYLLENIQIPRLSQQVYWCDFVIPYLEFQPSNVLKIVIAKLFERLLQLLSGDSNLKSLLEKTAFVPSGSIQSKPDDNVECELRRPIELYDPDNWKISELFFDDEIVFPSKNLPDYKHRILPLLRELGMKHYLSSDDIIQRLKIMSECKEIANMREIAHKKSMKLVQYIDEYFDKLVGKQQQHRSNNPKTNNNKLQQLHSVLLNTEWLPTVDYTGKQLFSKPKDCRDKEHKNTVGLIIPILDYRIKNKSFSTLLWNSYPSVDIVLKQLKTCSSISRIQLYHHHQNPDKICDSIYKYMKEALSASNKDQQSRMEIERFKQEILSTDENWIFCNDQFYPSSRVVFELDDCLKSNTSVIIQLPQKYKQYNELFSEMGVRQKIGIPDLINIIKEFRGFINTEVKILTQDEIDKIIGLIEQIAKKRVEQLGSNDDDSLNELLIPNSECQLVNFYEIQYDDMGSRLNDEKKKEYNLAHSRISSATARMLGMQMLAGKLIDEGDDFVDFGVDYEQEESLSIRIRNILNDYPQEVLFKEYLQNADDAGARKLCLVVDENGFGIPKTSLELNQHSLLTEEMNIWQGPALWIFNDAVFTEKDFESLLKLGLGRKSKDHTKIGRFGIGINVSFHLTDLVSFVSGEYIAFLDPSEKYLPKTGNPPRHARGKRINFLKSDFKNRFKDQTKPYISFTRHLSNENTSIFKGFKDFDFTEKFNGTLFRIPLRNPKIAQSSEISQKFHDARDLLQIFGEIKGNQEMLFLRSIEYCSLQLLRGKSKQIFWEAKIENMDSTLRNNRLLSSSCAQQLFQLEMEMNNRDRKSSEIWLVCTGGKDKTNVADLETFSAHNNIRARGGVASLLARSESRSLALLKKDRFPNPPMPMLTGTLYSFLSLPITTSLNVHINGTFYISSDRRNILQSESNSFLNEKSNSLGDNWNKHILFDILPQLHVTLLERIAELDYQRFLKLQPDQELQYDPITTTKLWPIVAGLSGMYKKYAEKVLMKSYYGNYKVCWTHADGGKFISFKEAYLAERKTADINEILAAQNIQIIKLTDEQINHFKSLEKTVKGQKVQPLKTINPQLVSHIFRSNPNIDGVSHENIFRLLKFIDQDKDLSRESLIGLKLLPLSDGTVGIFGNQEHYNAEPRLQRLFPEAMNLSKFIAEYPKELRDLFNDKKFCNSAKIKQVNASSIITLLEYELQRDKELDWNPNSKFYPNQEWIKQILHYFIPQNAVYEFSKLARLPLLPIIKPQEKLALLDSQNPVLAYDISHPMTSLLVKFGVKFTNFQFPEECNQNLKQCVLKSTFINMMKCLERTILQSKTSVDQLFNEKLKPFEINKFRNAVTKAFKSNTKNKKNTVISFLKTLPIWPTKSLDENVFISANSGLLIPQDLPLFSSDQNAKVFNAESDDDYLTLYALEVRMLDQLEYVRDNIIPYIVALGPIKECLDILKSIISIKDRDIESCLSLHPIFPNNSLTRLAKANELYDRNNYLFYTTFNGSDKFLHLDLCSDPECFEAIMKMGLNYQVSSQNFLECAHEIQSKIHDNTIDVINTSLHAMRYLYQNYSKMKFTKNQWQELINIEFIPVDLDLPYPYEEQAKKTLTGFESFASLRCQAYKNLCWTQCPLFNKSIDPPTSFLNLIKETGQPTIVEIVNNLIIIASRISQSSSDSWNSPNGIRTFLEILRDNYYTLNQLVDNSSEAKSFIESNLRKDDKLFLNNDDDPFNPNNWVAGQDIVFGVEDDVIVELHKVHPFLKDYKTLLKVLGAKELEKVNHKVKVRKHSQKDELFKKLLENFKQQEEIKHDVLFEVGENGTCVEKIYANSYVLSAASQRFEMLLSNNFNDKFSGSQKIKIAKIDGTKSQAFKIYGIQPSAFRILIRWLYGQSFKEALSEVLHLTNDDFSKALLLLISLIKLSDIFDLGPLKDLAEEAIIKGPYININNVGKIKKEAQNYRANQLQSHCEEYIKKNENLL